MVTCKVKKKVYIPPTHLIGLLFPELIHKLMNADDTNWFNCCILFDVSLWGYFAIHIPIFVLTVFLHNTKGLKKHTQLLICDYGKRTL
jgi:hypothetical protein